MSSKLNDFKWGRTSKARLKRLHIDLATVVDLAFTKYCTFDVSVGQTDRSIEEQRNNIRRGASKTMNSMHLPRRYRKRAKFAHLVSDYDHSTYCVSGAIDIRALKRNEIGKLTYTPEQKYYTAFAEAMRLAAIELGVNVVWGGCWTDITKSVTISDAKAAYVERCKQRGKKPFIDSGHFELARINYKPFAVEG